MEYKVIIGWDESNQIFYVVDSDITGLWLEAATFEALLDSIKDVAAELIEHNHASNAAPQLRIFRDIGKLVPVNYAA